jgi:hypothetical protein
MSLLVVNKNDKRKSLPVHSTGKVLFVTFYFIYSWTGTGTGDAALVYPFGSLICHIRQWNVPSHVTQRVRINVHRVII